MAVRKLGRAAVNEVETKLSWLSSIYPAAPLIPCGLGRRRGYNAKKKKKKKIYWFRQRSSESRSGGGAYTSERENDSAK